MSLDSVLEQRGAWHDQGRTWQLLLQELCVLHVRHGHLQQDRAQDFASEGAISFALLYQAREGCDAPAVVLQHPQLDVLCIVQPLCLLCTWAGRLSSRVLYM